MEKKRVLVRYGECLRCGQCCRLVELVTADVINKEKVQGNLNLQHFLKQEVAQSVHCVHLCFDPSTKLVSCGLFDKPNRPQFCIDHPSSPASLTKSCIGYKFEYEWLTDEEIAKLKPN